MSAGSVPHYALASAWCTGSAPASGVTTERPACRHHPSTRAPAGKVRAEQPAAQVRRFASAMSVGGRVLMRLSSPGEVARLHTVRMVRACLALNLVAVAVRVLHPHNRRASTSHAAIVSSVRVDAFCVPLRKLHLSQAAAAHSRQSRGAARRACVRQQSGGMHRSVDVATTRTRVTVPQHRLPGGPDAGTYSCRCQVDVLETTKRRSEGPWFHWHVRASMSECVRMASSCLEQNSMKGAEACVDVLHVLAAGCREHVSHSL